MSSNDTAVHSSHDVHKSLEIRSQWNAFLSSFFQPLTVALKNTVSGLDCGDNERVIGDDLRTHSGADRHQLIGLGDEDIKRMSRAVSRSSDVL